MKKKYKKNRCTIFMHKSILPQNASFFSSSTNKQYKRKYSDIYFTMSETFHPFIIFLPGTHLKTKSKQQKCTLRSSKSYSLQLAEMCMHIICFCSLSSSLWIMHFFVHLKSKKKDYISLKLQPQMLMIHKDFLFICFFFLLFHSV